MMKPLAAVLMIFLLASSAGCSSGSNKATTTQPPRTTTGSGTGAAQLKRAVRQALRDNDRVSGYVLWSNRVPAWASRSTRGPALANLRASATDRRRRGIRVRTLASKLKIISVSLDPSYTNATAVVRSIQRVRPYRAGAPMGRGVKLDERAQVELHRVAGASRFVVWRLTPIR